MNYFVLLSTGGENLFRKKIWGRRHFSPKKKEGEEFFRKRIRFFNIKFVHDFSGNLGQISVEKTIIKFPSLRS